MRVLVKNLCFLYTLIYTSVAISQPEIELEKFQKKYPGEKSVILSRKEFIDISKQGDSLQIIQTVYEERLILTDNAGIYASESIYFNSFVDVFDISAKSVVPVSGKYKDVKVKDFIIKDELETSVFSDDVKSINFYFPSLVKGSKTILEYKKNIKQPRFIPYTIFADFTPLDVVELKITCDKDIQIQEKYFNISKDSLNYSISEKKGKITYTWTRKNIKSVKNEELSPNYRYFLPHMHVYIKNYISKSGKNKSVINDVADLHKWYNSLVSNIEKEENEELNKIVDSITKEEENDYEKMRKIYYWVQDNIKYIAIEEGYGGFVPRSSAQVCEKRYGDCKDMANLIVQMAKRANVKAYHTWIGTREIPYTYTELPTPSTDNHMIASFEYEGEFYFLDATSNTLPIGLPSSFIQGKEALVNISDNSYKLVTVPVVDASVNRISDKVELTLNETKILGKGESKYEGYYKTYLTSRLDGLNEKDKIKSLRGFFNKGSNKFILDSISEVNLKDRDKALIINYKFNIEDYVKRNDDEIYINLNLDNLYSNDKIKSDRQNVYENIFNVSFSNSVKLNIPDGFKVSFVPQNTSYTSPDFEFKITYIQTENSITLEQKIKVNVLLLEKKDFDSWNKMIDKLNKAYREVVILKKI